MQKENRYPKIGIRSKNELAKRISDSKFSQEESLKLINYVLNNYDSCWRDVKSASNPQKGKFVRSANVKLKNLLKRINTKILSSYDNKVPEFFFGGVSGKNHIQAVHCLLGKKRKRIKLGLDIHRFFEQVSVERISNFFYNKCGCSKKASNMLASLCCVPFGPKNSGSDRIVLARGFSTSTRLALWCNLDIFYKIYWKTKKTLKGRDARIAIFIDDIGITASNTSKEEMEKLTDQIKHILESSDPNQSLRLNEKTSIQMFNGHAEHLGLTLGRNKIGLGRITKSRHDNIKNVLKDKSIDDEKKKSLVIKHKSYKGYIHSIKKVK